MSEGYFCLTVSRGNKLRIICSAEDKSLVRETLLEVEPGEDVKWHKSRAEYLAFIDGKDWL